MWGHATRERGLSLQREAEPALRLQSALEGKPCPKSRDASRRDQPTPVPREPGTARDGLTWVPRALCTLPPLAPRTSAQETHSKGLLSDPGSVSTSSRSVALLHSGCRQPGGPPGRPVRGQFPPRRLPPEEPGRAQEWRASAAAPLRSNAFYPQVYRWILNTFPSPRPFLYSLKYFYWA